MIRVVLDITGITVEVDEDDARHAMDVYGQDNIEGGATVFARESVYNLVNNIRTSRDIDLTGEGIDVREVHNDKEGVR